MSSTKYNYYLRDPFEKDPVVISKYRKAGKKPTMVMSKKTHKNEAKYYSTGECTIYLSVRYNKKRVVLNTGERINPAHWNFETKIPKIGKAFGLKEDLDIFKKRIKDLFSELRNNEKENRFPTIEEIRLRAKLHEDSEFFNVFDNFLFDYRKNDIVRSFKQTRDKIFKMNPGIEFNDIDLNFYDRFISVLEMLGLNQNTQGRHIKNLKLFMKWSRKRKHHKNRDSEDFESRSEQVEKFFFNPGELEAIIDHKFKEGSKLDKVRDLFIVSAFTALRYEDYTRLEPKHISTGMLKIISAKSNIELSAQILPEAQAIFDKWLRITEGESIIPPKISNVKMNLYLKEMVRLIDKIKDVQLLVKKDKKETWFKKADQVTTHTGRRSFCSNMHYMGMPSKTIMKASGHTTMSSFEKYVLGDDQNYFQETGGILEAYLEFKEKRKLRIVS